MSLFLSNYISLYYWWTWFLLVQLAKISPPAFINIESSFNIIPGYTSYNTTQVKVYVNQAFWEEWTYMKHGMKIFGCNKNLMKKNDTIKNFCFHDNINRFLKIHRKDEKHSPLPFFFDKKLFSVVHISFFSLPALLWVMKLLSLHSKRFRRINKVSSRSLKCWNIN